MSLQHIQKNSPRLLPKPAKFEKNPPNGYRVIRKTKCGAGGAGGAGGARCSPIHKQASLAGRLIISCSSQYLFITVETCLKYGSCNILAGTRSNVMVRSHQDAGHLYRPHEVSIFYTLQHSRYNLN